MLIELRIRDYAVIDDLTLDGAPGLNALSGETGSGKSLVANALSCLLGEHLSSRADLFVNIVLTGFGGRIPAV